MFEWIEDRNGIVIVFAVLCGSRIWGYNSPDSDYDIKFVYRDRAADRGIRDELVQMADVGGKLLECRGVTEDCFTSVLSNGDFFFADWLVSPVLRGAGLLDGYSALMCAVDPAIVVRSYFEKVRVEYNDICRGIPSPLRIKYYIYVIQYIARGVYCHRMGEIAPANLEEMLLSVADVFPVPVLTAFWDLLEKKRSSSKVDTVVERHPLLDAFVEKWLAST